mmetsp:Transcript_19403/g.34391  ORF Transcript_19403/g.34391 Transcript_19403/m.34391 type:complete len:214 (+) Transcript_19403:614-1255(+)
MGQQRPQLHAYALDDTLHCVGWNGIQGRTPTKHRPIHQPPPKVGQFMNKRPRANHGDRGNHMRSFLATSNENQRPHSPTHTPCHTRTPGLVHNLFHKDDANCRHAHNCRHTHDSNWLHRRQLALAQGAPWWPGVRPTSRNGANGSAHALLPLPQPSQLWQLPWPQASGPWLPFVPGSVALQPAGVQLSSAPSVAGQPQLLAGGHAASPLFPTA